MAKVKTKSVSRSGKALAANMNDLKTPKTIKSYFGKMLEASDSMDEEDVKQLHKSAKAAGIDFTIHTKKSTKWDLVDGVKYATVTQHSQLMLGGVVVSKWNGTYFGTYGCMGSGWWVEELDGPDFEDGVEELMETCEVYPENPEVPEPIRVDGE